MRKAGSIKKQRFHILTPYKKILPIQRSFHFVNVEASKVSQVDVIGLHHLGTSSQADPKANRVANTRMSNNCTSSLPRSCITCPLRSAVSSVLASSPLALPLCGLRCWVMMLRPSPCDHFYHYYYSILLFSAANGSNPGK